eukprot:UN25779
MEQYISVKDYLHNSLVWCALAVFLCLWFFLMNFFGSFYVLFSIAMAITDVYGYAHWADLTMNGMLALNLVVGVGIAVEFHAHVARFFMMADGENRSAYERILQALENTFIPITLAAISTLLGVLPVAFTTFPYFRQYFFFLYVFIVTFSWLHGLFLLPIFLYLFHQLLLI